jgi:ABC-type lipoprotein release transport system permease subunit
MWYQVQNRRSCTHGDRLGARRRSYSVVAAEVSAGVALGVVLLVVTDSSSPGGAVATAARVCPCRQPHLEKRCEGAGQI